MRGCSCRNWWLACAAMLAAGIGASAGGTDPLSNGVNSRVNALEFVMEDGVPVLWIGGRFSEVAGGQRLDGFARYQPHGPGFAPIPGGQPNGEASAFLPTRLNGSDVVFVGGSFDEVETNDGTLALNNIGMWQDGDWFPLATGLYTTARRIAAELDAASEGED